ncbi:hypothetical protein WOC76_03675 [Methylocystis sp. IM3]|uniref:hypothetical protein n=1 Tax=unclassified Methylocystis TaxID=2625913 RepID=UPI0030F93C3A
MSWSNYDEPESAELEAAFDALLKGGQRFDAIIVDEGQDFRSEWWLLVEAALIAPDAGILYIFHDDHQALLPHRAGYPDVDAVPDLSRNCRNSAKVFDLVRYFHAQAPETELQLRSKGQAWIERVPIGLETDGLRRVLSHAVKTSLTESKIVILLSGGLQVSSWPLIGNTIQVSTSEPWQGAVARCFEGVICLYDRDGVTIPTKCIGERPCTANQLEP